MSLKTYPEITEQVVRSKMGPEGSFSIEALNSIEVRLDNVCNMMCRHCSPD
jgi:hypothetical protein